MSDLTSHVLGEGGGDDDDVLGHGGEALDAQVHHPSQNGVLALEELGDGEEALCGLRGAHGLALVDEVEDLGHDVGALARVHRRLVEEDPRLLLG